MYIVHVNVQIMILESSLYFIEGNTFQLHVDNSHAAYLKYVSIHVHVYDMYIIVQNQAFRLQEDC